MLVLRRIAQGLQHSARLRRGFIYGIPQPLGIGAVALEDGEQVRGFICEPIGVIGAEDITRFRGWRAYLQSLDHL